MSQATCLGDLVAEPLIIHGLAVPGRADDTTTLVLWLQSVHLFVDLRIPAQRPSFAGCRALTDLPHVRASDPVDASLGEELLRGRDQGRLGASTIGSLGGHSYAIRPRGPNHVS